MSTFSMDAGSIAELWHLNPEQNAAYPPKLSGQTISNVRWKDDKVHFARVKRFIRLDYEFEIESDGLFVLNGFW